MTGLPALLSPALNRTGTAWDQVSLAPMLPTLQSRPVVPMVDIPIPVRHNFDPMGIDAFGHVVGRHYGLGSHARSNDGGVTWKTFTPSGAITTMGSFFWVDRAGNKYSAAGNSVYRAAAGENNWVFALAFTFVESYATGFSFACDPSGGVYFAEYSTSGLDKRGRQFWRSTDYGVTWSSQIIDYNQKHLHNVHFHDATSTLYLTVGEVYPGGTTLPALPPIFRGVLYSTNQGATWTQVVRGDGSYAAGSQPTSAVSIGGKIFQGKDQTPSGYLVIDAATNTYLPTLATHTHGGASPDYTGFHFATPYFNGLMVCTPYGSGDSYFPVLAIADDGTLPVAMSSPLGAQKVVGTWSWVDGAGNVWVKDVVSAFYGVTFKVPRIRRKRAYSLTNTATPVAQFNWDTASLVLAGETYQGKKILRMVPGPIPTGLTPFTATTPVTPGEKLQFAWLCRRGPGATGNLRLECRFEDAGGVAVQTLYLSVDPKNTSQSVFNHAQASAVVPATTATVRCRWEASSGTAGDYHDVTSNLTITKAGAWAAWAPDGAYSDSVSFTHPATTDFLFTDRIYVQGVADMWAAGNVPLLTVNHIEVGVRAAAAGSGGVVYLKESGVEVGSWPAGLWGGTVDMTRKPSMYLAAQQRQMHIVPAPVLVGMRSNSILIYSPQTTTVTSVPLTTNLTGTLSVILTGSALHLPRFWGNVPTQWVQPRMLAA